MNRSEEMEDIFKFTEIVNCSKRIQCFKDVEEEEVEEEYEEKEEIITSNIDISQYFTKEYGGYDNEINICPQHQSTNYQHQSVYYQQQPVVQKPIPEHLNICWPLMILPPYPLYNEFYDKMY